MCLHTNVLDWNLMCNISIYKIKELTLWYKKWIFESFSFGDFFHKFSLSFVSFDAL